MHEFLLGGWRGVLIIFVLFLALAYVFEPNPPVSRGKECSCSCGLILRR